jgi:hypothetical protein
MEKTLNNIALVICVLLLVSLIWQRVQTERYKEHTQECIEAYYLAQTSDSTLTTVLVEEAIYQMKLGVLKSYKEHNMELFQNNIDSLADSLILENTSTIAKLYE